ALDVHNTDRKDDERDADLRRWRAFGDQAAAELVKSRLTGVPVLIVAVRGADAASVGKARDLLDAAGAKLEGTVWFTAKMALDPKKPNDADQLAELLDLQAVAPDTVRQVALSRLAAAWGTNGASNPLVALRQAGFIDYEAPAGP